MTGEVILFWTLAPLTVLAALGMLLVKKAVHSAILLAFVMIALAVFYLIQDAPFLGVVQIVVYTGAVMMLFLFILMLVGVDSSDSLVENIKESSRRCHLYLTCFCGHSYISYCACYDWKRFGRFRAR